MCGPDPNKASKKAAKTERERQQQVADTTAAIDKAFAGRGGQLEEFANALRTDFRDKLNREKTDVDRNLKFALARSGNTGGSVAVDAGRRKGREFQDALLQGERGVQGSLADLASADEVSRRNLIGLAQGGAGLTSSVQNAANALRSNIAGAQSQGLAADIGSTFSGTRDLFVKAEEAAARRRGLRESEVFAEPFSRG